MTVVDQPTENRTVPVCLDADATGQAEPNQVAHRHQYTPRNRALVQARQEDPTSNEAVSSDVTVACDLGDQGYQTRSVASETQPNRFQETRILSLREVERRTYEALRRAEQKRKDYVRQEAEQAYQ